MKINVYLSQAVLDRLIDFVNCISDPLLSLIRRAEVLFDPSDTEVCCEVYPSELRRLADIQEQIGDKDDDEVLKILQLLIKSQIGDHSKVE